MAASKKPRPVCAEPVKRVWRLVDAGPTYHLARAGAADVGEADGWEGRLVHWDWSVILKKNEHCLYALLETSPSEADEGPNLAPPRVAALFGLAPKARVLETASTMGPERAERLGRDAVP